MSYIYIITNNANGKQYIGQHRYDGEGVDTTYKGSGVLLKKAYRKYGIENFSMKVLEFCEDVSLDSLEVKYISEYNTKTPNGYNLTDGGGGCSGKAYSEEQKENMRKAQNRPEVKEKKRRWATGRVMSEATKEKLSVKAKERYKDPVYYNKIKEHLAKTPHGSTERIFICPLKLAYLNLSKPLLKELADAFGCDFRIVRRRAEKYGIKLNPRQAWTGRKHTEEWKKDMSERMSGRAVSEETRKKLSESRKGVKIGPMSEESKSKISMALKGRVFTEEWKQKLSISMTGKPNISARKPVRQIDKITNETVCEWPCIKDAADTLGIAHADISKCCKGKSKTCGGYKWAYIN